MFLPESESRFSLRKLWTFTGPGFLISMAFLDPGNIEADLEAGAEFKYKLLWVVLAATLLGLVAQRLAARLGVVTGHHLSEMCHQHYHTFPNVVMWIMVEIAIIGSDMQEVIGTSIALYLLSNKWIPLWAGVIITVVDAFTFLLLDRYGLRKLEILFAFLIGVMAVSFGWEYATVAPAQDEVVKGIFYPWCEGCQESAVLMIVGLLGATIQPHNLFLHSALVKSRKVDRKDAPAVREANFYFFIETCLALLVSFLINVFVVSVFGAGLYGKTNQDVREICEKSGSAYTDVFLNNTETVSADIYSGGVFLGCQFGLVAMYIWGVGLLAAGQASTMAGCYSGQFVMEGFLDLHWVRWKRVLFTRTVAILPTFCVAYFNDLRNLSDMNGFLNVLMTLQLPFAMLPLIGFTGNKAVMGEFVNGLCSNVATMTIAVAIVGINIYSGVTMVLTYVGADTLYLSLLGVFSVLYLLFCAYIAVHMMVGLGVFKGLTESSFVQKYVVVHREPKTEGKIYPATIVRVGEFGSEEKEKEWRRTTQR